MPTRQFIFVLAIAAMIASGVGLVVGSRTAPDGTPFATQVVSTQSSSTAKKPAADAPVETDSAPVTKSIEIAQPKAADVATKQAEANGKRKTAGANSDANPAAKTDAKSDAKSKTKGPETAKPVASDPSAPKATDASKNATVTAPTSGAAIQPTATDPELVFVTRSSLVKARTAANEAAAIATLRSLGSAEAVMEASGVIDTDHDDLGEYAYFGELSGAVPCRAASGETREKLTPAVLNASNFQVTGAGNVMRSGYLFRIYLPGATVDDKTTGIAESADGGWDGKGPEPDPDACEVLWSCYAWPIDAGNSGMRAFFLNQEGDLLVLANSDGAYSGEAHAPTFDAASTIPGDMAQEPVPGATYADGRLWSLYSGREPEMPRVVELGPATAADAEMFNKPDSKADKFVLPRKLLHPGETPKKPAATEKAPTKSAMSEKSALLENEGKVVANLRMISIAQSKAQALAVIDTDKDGQGEYGFFGELAGTSGCRAPAGGKRTLMQPRMLDAAWGKVTDGSNVVMDGYVYRMYLPAGGKGKTTAICEAPGGGCVVSGTRPDHDHAENLWTVYAWPLQPGKDGQRAFFMNQAGQILVTPNTDGLYTGEQRAPAFDAALSASKAGDMYGAVANGGMAVDGRVWSALN